MRVVEGGASFMSMLTRKLVNGEHAQAQDVRNENGNFPFFCSFSFSVSLLFTLVFLCSCVSVIVYVSTMNTTL